MASGDDAYTPEEIRDLLYRREVATSRQRAAVTKQLGLDHAEAEALAHLAREGAMTPSELGERLGMSSGGVTMLLRRLERTGRVSRRAHPRDKRKVIITAAPATLEQAQAHYRELVAEMDRIAARLPDSERRAIGRYLDQVALVSERYAERAQAAASVRDGDEPHEPVELWA